MPWAKLDDHFCEHPKVAPLSDAAFRLHVTALLWCNRYLTDGAVPGGVVGVLYPDPSQERPPLPRILSELIAAGLWEKARVGDYSIHDFLAYNKSATQVKADRDAAAKRQADWREKGTKQQGVRNGVSNATRNGVSNGHVTRDPNPDPDPSSETPLTPLTKGGTKRKSKRLTKGQREARLGQHVEPGTSAETEERLQVQFRLAARPGNGSTKAYRAWLDVCLEEPRAFTDAKVAHADFKAFQLEQKP